MSPPAWKFNGPGGSHVLPEWKEALVGYGRHGDCQASAGCGHKAKVIIDSGDVHALLNRAAEQAKSDLLVIGHSPVRGHLGDNGNGYGIIRESHIRS